MRGGGPGDSRANSSAIAQLKHSYPQGDSYAAPLDQTRPDQTRLKKRTSQYTVPGTDAGARGASEGPAARTSAPEGAPARRGASRVDSVEMRGSDRPARSDRPWSDEEERWLRRHRADGRAAVAAAMGRSEEAVRAKARRLGIAVPASPVIGELCPVCGYRRTTAGTEAARAGMCVTCWARHKREVYEARRDELAEERAYDAAKKRARRDAR